jgi:hypothetical protein
VDDFLEPIGYIEFMQTLITIIASTIKCVPVSINSTRRTFGKAARVPALANSETRHCVNANKLSKPPFWKNATGWREKFMIHWLNPSQVFCFRLEQQHME